MILMIKNDLLSFAVCVCAYAGFFYVDSANAQDMHAKRLHRLMREYTVRERQTLHSLPPFGIYCPTIDTSLIEEYLNEIQRLLALDELSKEEKAFVKNIAYKLMRGRVYRNASCNSRWKNYAKQGIIRVLLNSEYGLSILAGLAQNPQFHGEIDAYLIAHKSAY